MVLIQVLLPTTGGRPGAPEAALVTTTRELAGTFDGVTAYVRSPAKGLWTAPDGNTERDDLVMVEVVTERFDRQWWQLYAAMLAQRFHQNTIHVRALGVELLDGVAEGPAQHSP